MKKFILLLCIILFVFSFRTLAADTSFVQKGQKGLKIITEEFSTLPAGYFTPQQLLKIEQGQNDTVTVINFSKINNLWTGLLFRKIVITYTTYTLPNFSVQNVRVERKTDVETSALCIGAILILLFTGLYSFIDRKIEVKESGGTKSTKSFFPGLELLIILTITVLGVIIPSFTFLDWKAPLVLLIIVILVIIIVMKQ